MLRLFKPRILRFVVLLSVASISAHSFSLDWKLFLPAKAAQVVNKAQAELDSIRSDVLLYQERWKAAMRECVILARYAPVHEMQQRMMSLRQATESWFSGTYGSAGKVSGIAGILLDWNKSRVRFESLASAALGSLSDKSYRALLIVLEKDAASELAQLPSLRQCVTAYAEAATGKKNQRTRICGALAARDIKALCAVFLNPTDDPAILTEKNAALRDAISRLNLEKSFMDSARSLAPRLFFPSLEFLNEGVPGLSDFIDKAQTLDFPARRRIALSAFEGYDLGLGFLAFLAGMGPEAFSGIPEKTISLLESLQAILVSEPVLPTVIAGQGENVVVALKTLSEAERLLYGKINDREGAFVAIISNVEAVRILYETDDYISLRDFYETYANDALTALVGSLNADEKALKMARARLMAIIGSTEVEKPFSGSLQEFSGSSIRFPVIVLDSGSTRICMQVAFGIVSSNDLLERAFKSVLAGPYSKIAFLGPALAAGTEGIEQAGMMGPSFYRNDLRMRNDMRLRSIARKSGVSALLFSNMESAGTIGFSGDIHAVQFSQREALFFAETAILSHIQAAQP